MITGPATITLGPIQTLFPIQGTPLYGNFLTEEKRNPKTQFTPIFVPGIKTVETPLQTRYVFFPIDVSGVILLLYNTSVKIYRSIVTFNISIMSRKNKNQTNIWIAIEAIFLIILLIIWLTVADFTGDTDVAAFIAPAFSGLTFLKL